MSDTPFPNTMRIQMMRNVFRGDLIKLRENLLLLGSHTESSMVLAIEALVNRDESRAQFVQSKSADITKLLTSIDQLIVTFMSTRNPMATEGRLMMAAARIAIHLGEFSEHAQHLAHRSVTLCTEPVMEKIVSDISQMGWMALDMIRKCLDSFVQARHRSALDIIDDYKKIKALYDTFEGQIHQEITKEPAAARRLIHLLACGISCEQAGDAARHIAQAIFYLYTAKDVRYVDDTSGL